MESLEPVKAEPNRQANGTFGPGNNANPNGRPKGQSLKEFWKQRLSLMTEEEKLQFSKDIGKELQWRMAEGNPAQTTDLNVELKPSPILGNIIEHGLSSNNSNKEDIEDAQED